MERVKNSLRIIILSSSVSYPWLWNQGNNSSRIFFCASVVSGALIKWEQSQCWINSDKKINITFFCLFILSFESYLPKFSLPFFDKAKNAFWKLKWWFPNNTSIAKNPNIWIIHFSIATKTEIWIKIIREKFCVINRRCWSFGSLEKPGLVLLVCLTGKKSDSSFPAF